ARGSGRRPHRAAGGRGRYQAARDQPPVGRERRAGGAHAGDGDEGGAARVEDEPARGDVEGGERTGSGADGAGAEHRAQDSAGCWAYL
ncbi:hypothetical protein LTR91_027087, partial [Friedmanniomyces endolithicus]